MSECRRVVPPLSAARSKPAAMLFSLRCPSRTPCAGHAPPIPANVRPSNLPRRLWPGRHRHRPCRCCHREGAHPPCRPRALGRGVGPLQVPQGHHQEHAFPRHAPTPLVPPSGPRVSKAAHGGMLAHGRQPRPAGCARGSAAPGGRDRRTRPRTLSSEWRVQRLCFLFTFPQSPAQPPSDQHTAHSTQHAAISSTLATRTSRSVSRASRSRHSGPLSLSLSQ